MALKTIQVLLEEVQDAISKTMLSQEYEIANRRQKRSLLLDLEKREERLINMGDKKGYDSTVAGKSSNGAYLVQLG